MVTVEVPPEDDSDCDIPIVLRVDRVIRQLIKSGNCSAGTVANTLNMRLRTLQYQLKQNNTSYQSRYNTVRLDLARYYLGTSRLSISVVAERLGFTDSAAFSNFFKDRAGCRPRDYVKRTRKAS